LVLIYNHVFQLLLFFEKVEIIAQKTIKSFMKPQRFFEGFEITRTCTSLIAGFFLRSRTGQHCYVPQSHKFSFLNFWYFFKLLLRLSSLSCEIFQFAHAIKDFMLLKIIIGHKHPWTFCKCIQRFQAQQKHDTNIAKDMTHTWVNNANKVRTCTSYLVYNKFLVNVPREYDNHFFYIFLWQITN